MRVFSKSVDQDQNATSDFLLGIPQIKTDFHKPSMYK